MLGSAPQTSVSGTLTTASGNIFAFNDAAVQVGVNIAAAVASSTFLKVRSFDVKILNNAEAQFVAGKIIPDSIIVKNFAVTGQMVLAFEDTVQKANFLALTKQAMVVTFTGFGIGNNMQEFVKLRFYKLRIDDFKIAAPVDGIITQEVDFTAEYSSLDGATMDIQLRNIISGY